jgi:hypothetical protein
LVCWALFFFAATPIFLILSRQGTAAILLVSPAALMAIYARMHKTSNTNFKLLLLVVTVSLCLYVPGMIWWIVAGLILGRKKISGLIENVSPAVITFTALFGLLLIAPLAFSLIRDWTLIKPLALIPNQFSDPLLTLKNIAWMAAAIFVKAPYHSIYILGRLPIINVVQIALLAFGLYALWSASKKKLFVLVSNIIFAVVVAGINNKLILLSLSLPAIAVIVCAGLRYLYIEWRSVFPRNPVARAVALTLMGALVIVHLLFGVRYAAVAWPSSTPTKNAYVLK